MASCVRNICTKNYQKLIIAFSGYSHVIVKNVGDTVYLECQHVLRVVV